MDSDQREANPGRGGDRGRKAPTIYDVARKAEVSISTVSRVLNKPQSVSRSTRERVLTAIEQLGFVPSAEASARARRDFRRIGVLTPFFTAPAFVQRLRGVAAALAGSNYELIVYAVESLAQLRGYLDMLPVSGRVDGLIIMSLPVDERAAHRLRSTGLETVIVESVHPLFACVEIDNREGGRLAAGFLADRGYRRCAFLGETGEPDYALHPSDLRLAGFREALEARGCGLRDSCVVRAAYLMEDAMRKARDLLSLAEPPEAVFAGSDLQGVGVLRAAHAMGLRVPEDVAVIGFDNLDLAEYLGLTTVDQGLEESGRTAVDMLTARLENHGRALQNRRIHLRVIERRTA